MILLMPAAWFSLLGFFAKLVRREAQAAIRRKQADDIKKAKIKKKKAKAKAAAEKAYEKEEKKKAAARKRKAAALQAKIQKEKERQEKSKLVQADMEKRLEAFQVPAEVNPYKPGPPDSER